MTPDFMPGMGVTIAVDADDPRYEVIIFRVPRNSAMANGRPDTPLCNLTGRPAWNRMMRFWLTRAAGALAEDKGSPKVIDALMRVRKKFEDV